MLYDLRDYRNFNGVQEEDEPNLAGWNFTPTTPAGQSTATTDAQGNAFFSGLIGDYGTYTLAETLQAGWTNSTPISQSRERSAADPWTQWRANFGNGRYSVLEILKFLDSDGDQVWDEGQEPSLPSWQFALYIWRNGDWVQHRGGTTGPDGRLIFTDLIAGEYRLIEQVANHPGYWATSSGWIKTATASRIAMSWGSRGSRSSYSSRSAAPGSPRAHSAPTPTVNTSGVTCRAGSYYVRFTPPSGYSITRRDQGGDDTRDSDADPDTGATIPITLQAGDNQPQWDAGLYQPPAIDIEKYVSVDGQQTWQDADTPTGPQTRGGADVYFRFVVTNIGNVPLSDVTLSDNVFALTGCPAIPNPLQPSASYTCIFGPTPAQVGQHVDTATATGRYSDITVRDTDDAHYYAPPRPALGLEKYYRWTASRPGTTPTRPPARRRSWATRSTSASSRPTPATCR